jgi:hypothetical protein
MKPINLCSIGNDKRIHTWTDGQRDGRTRGRMDGWTDGRTGGQTSR